MDQADYINKRKGKYMAQVLEEIEEGFAALVPPGNGEAIDAYRRQRTLSTSRDDAERERGKRAFEEHVMPLLPVAAAAVIQNVKGTVRARMNALATDAIDVMRLGERAARNGLAQEFRDRLHPEGRPEGVRIT